MLWAARPEGETGTITEIEDCIVVFLFYDKKADPVFVIDSAHLRGGRPLTAPTVAPDSVFSFQFATCNLQFIVLLIKI